MIYKSIKYLDFMMDQLNDYGHTSKHGLVEKLIVANDATPEVLNHLREKVAESYDVGFRHVEYRDLRPEEYYINRVYRAWNFGASCATGDIIVFVNSDMAFSFDWLDNLLRELTPETIPTSRLVESGKMPSGQHALSLNFGRSPEEFEDDDDWIDFTNCFRDIRLEREGAGYTRVPVKTMEGGLYMPCAFYREDFLKAGGYPEGNVYDAGVGRVDSRFKMSGDSYFFNYTMKHKRHITVMDSLVYHIQEGEMDE